jgi:hypothetical protein
VELRKSVTSDSQLTQVLRVSVLLGFKKEVEQIKERNAGGALPVSLYMRAYGVKEGDSMRV